MARSMTKQHALCLHELFPETGPTSSQAYESEARAVWC